MSFNNSLTEYSLHVKAYLKKENKAHYIVNKGNSSIIIFVECHRISESWKEIAEFIYQFIGFKIKFSGFNVLFGYQHRDKR